MVEAIGWKGPGIVTKVTSAATSAPVAAVDAPKSVEAGQTTADTGGAAALGRQMSAGPPVDADRVSKIKAAIAAGKFPILPSTIADRLLALKLEWNPNDRSRDQA